MTKEVQMIMNMETAINDPLEILRSRRGKFTKVYYTNQKGECKRYIVRTGVKKHLMGGIKHYIPDSITVYSVTCGNTGYKTFVKSNIHSIISKGKQVYPIV